MPRPSFELTDIDKRVEDKAVLVGVEYGREGWRLAEDLAELARLADTAGARIVATVTQKLDHPSPKTFVGAGKAEEIARVVTENAANLVVFDEELTPSQQANLEIAIPETKILDRTALILDIFALHATSTEGKLQVELAQMEYLLPRLRGLWRHFEQAAAAAGGTRGIGTRGPGETQLETDRRLARKRIGDLRRELKRVNANRQLQRHARTSSGVFRVALIGYTNSGKSTLLNVLTDAHVLVEDQLFATLDSTTRRVELPEGRAATLTDTVGFINKLPHGLVEAFKSTLDEVREADLLLQVVDASHSQMREQMAAVAEVLGELGAADRPQVLVFNKTDAMPPEDLARLRVRFPDAGFISARMGAGLDALRARVADEAAKGSRTVDLLLPYTKGDLVRLIHESGQVLSEEHTGEGTRVRVRIPPRLAKRVAEYEVGRHRERGGE